LLLIAKTTHEVKCWRLTPGKNYTAIQDSVNHSLLLIDGPDEPVMSSPQQFWSYDVLEETE